MAPLQKILCTIGITTAAAFSPAHIQHHNHAVHQRRLSPLCSDKGGGSAIAAPKTKTVTTTEVKQKQKQEQKKKFKPSDPDLFKQEDFEDAPMFRLFLIGDESYEQEHVVTRLVNVVEDCSEDNAADYFKAAYQGGEAFMGKYPREIAEMYAEQLTRSEPIIYMDVRDDKD
jgi:ATP-dependent Clp protease adapter protein ClpS